MIIKNLLKYLKNTEMNEMLSAIIIIVVIAIPVFIFSQEDTLKEASFEKYTYTGTGTITEAIFDPQLAEFKKVQKSLAPISEEAKKCFTAYKKQEEYLKNEKLSEKFTFKNYTTNNTKLDVLSDLDLNFSKTARMFKTDIRNQLDEKGVNFNGKYTIVGVGMTGRGGADWIVDRTNGKAYEFPYVGLSLSYKKDSNLIIINSKVSVQNLSHYDNEEYNCDPYIESGRAIMVYKLIPHYFLWKDNRLEHLGPKKFVPLTNLFWGNYFKN